MSVKLLVTVDVFFLSHGPHTDTPNCCLYFSLHFTFCLTCNSCTCSSVTKLVPTVSFLFSSFLALLFFPFKKNLPVILGAFDRVWIYSLMSRVSWLTAAQWFYALLFLISSAILHPYMSFLLGMERRVVALRTHPPPYATSRMERGKSPPHDRESDRKDWGGTSGPSRPDNSSAQVASFVGIRNEELQLCTTYIK